MKSSSSKRIAIFGAGGVGCYFGGLLLDAGYDVEFIARGKQLHAISAKGLTFESENVLKTFKATAREKLEGLYDIVLISVKSKDTPQAAKACVGHLTEGGYAVSLQNGVENPAIIAAYIGADKVLPAVVYLTASIKEAGHVKTLAKGRLFVNSYDEKNTKHADDFETILKHTAIVYFRPSDIKLEQWKKLMLNITYNPLSALFAMTYGELTSNPEIIAIAKGIFEEARQAAALCGVEITEDYFDKVNNQCANNPAFKTSMLQDIETNKKPETDALLGAVVRIFETAGKKAYCCEQLLQIMNVKFGGWYHTSPRLASDVLFVCKDEVLLIERKYEPQGWAIPGGMVDLYETMENAAARELEEETGTKVLTEKLELLGIYSDPTRDNRGHTASAVYVYHADQKPQVKGGDDAANAVFYKLNALPDHIAFDHRKVIEDYKSKYKIT